MTEAWRTDENVLAGELYTKLKTMDSGIKGVKVRPFIDQLYYPHSKRIPPKGRDKDEAILMNISNRLQYLNKNISDVGRAQNIIKETVEYIGHYLQNKRIESGKERGL